MKKTLLYLAIALLGTAAFTSCDNDFEMPKMIVPEATISANTTIAELKQVIYKQGAGANNYANVIGKKADGSDYIIAGRVISSDQAGNIFKQIVIRDNTSAIQININAYDLYESYQYGQEVVVNVTGLYGGAYGRLVQVGAAPTNGYPARIETSTFSTHAQVNGLAKPSAVDTVELTIPELKAITSGSEAWLDMQCELVRIKGVSFADAGTATLSTSGSSGVSRNLKDADGNTIILYTSGYSDFWNYYCPTGTGSVTAILSCYNANWQLRLNDIEGLQGFDELTTSPSGNGNENGGGSTTTTTAIYSEAFTTDLGKFVTKDVTLPGTSTYVWKASSYGAVASGFVSSAAHASESWLVSPEIDLTGATTANVSFDHALNKFADVSNFKTEATLWVKVKDGSWTQLTGVTYPESQSWTFVNSKTDLSAYLNKTIQIAFRYISTTTSAGSWEVKNFAINTAGGGTVGTNPGAGTLPQ